MKFRTNEEADEELCTEKEEDFLTSIEKFIEPRRSEDSHFLTDTFLNIRISDVAWTPRSNILHPYLYTIDITHGPYTWTIKRRYDTIRNLHSKLQVRDRPQNTTNL